MFSERWATHSKDTIKNIYSRIIAFFLFYSLGEMLRSVALRLKVSIFYSFIQIIPLHTILIEKS